MPVLTLEMLPAEYGDCLWIEYGSEHDKHRILIDTGPGAAFPALQQRIEQIKDKNDRRFDLFVITHIDADHLGGAVKLLQKKKQLGLSFGDIWFNGYRHLSDVLGAEQAEELSRTIQALKLPWNIAFDGKAVAVAGDALPKKDVSGMSLTLLSPYPEQLKKLEPIWAEAVKAAGLEPGGEVEEEQPAEEDLLGDVAIDVDKLAASKFKPDDAVSNGTSIAFLAEFDGKRVLFSADAHAPVLLESVQRLAKGNKLDVSAFKLPHHGSRANLSADLLDRLACRRFLVSTNGKRYRHPNREAIARAIRSCTDASLIFNYRSEFTAPWGDTDLQTHDHYTAAFPKTSSGGIKVTI
jgi:beta-lactamase superfamily II metal-dependent hydrolase